MPLNDVQDLFARTMLAPPEAVEKPEAALAALFTASPAVLPERLQIYRNTVVGSLTDVLLATYPLVKTLTGEDFATVMMRSYVIAHPPGEACLARYGGGFPDFVAGFAPAAAIAYLPDIARLEWAMNEAYSAPDDTPLAPNELRGVPADALADLALRPRDSVRLVASRWPLESIRAFCQNYDEQNPGTLNLDAGAARLLVFRPELAVEVVALADDECAFFEALLAGKTLGDAIDRTLRAHPAFDFGALLARHLELKTFRSIT